MKIIKGGDLWRKLQEMPFFKKPLVNLTKSELELLLKIAIDHVEYNGEEYAFKLPWYEGNGVLHIPCDAPEEYKIWRRKLTAKEKYDLFLSMAVPPEDLHYFMHAAEIEEAEREVTQEGA